MLKGKGLIKRLQTRKNFLSLICNLPFQFFIFFHFLCQYVIWTAHRERWGLILKTVLSYWCVFLMKSKFIFKYLLETQKVYILGVLQDTEILHPGSYSAGSEVSQIVIEAFGRFDGE